jgi:hypothetical protein
VHRGAAGPEEAILVQHQADVIRLATCAWDALAGALPDEAEDAHHLHQAPWGEDVEKLAGRALDARALAARQ